MGNSTTLRDSRELATLHLNAAPCSPIHTSCFLHIFPRAIHVFLCMLMNTRCVLHMHVAEAAPLHPNRWGWYPGMVARPPSPELPSSLPHSLHQCTPVGEVVDKSAGLCAQLLGQPLPTPLPKNIGEYEAFLESGRVPVSGLLYKILTNKFSVLAQKLLDMGSDQSFLVSHFTSSIELSLSSSLPPGGS